MDKVFICNGSETRSRRSKSVCWNNDSFSYPTFSGDNVPHAERDAGGRFHLAVSAEMVAELGLMLLLRKSLAANSLMLLLPICFPSSLLWIVAFVHQQRLHGDEVLQDLWQPGVVLPQNAGDARLLSANPAKRIHIASLISTATSFPTLCIPKDNLHAVKFEYFFSI